MSTPHERKFKANYIQKKKKNPEIKIPISSRYL